MEICFQISRGIFAEQMVSLKLSVDISFYKPFFNPPSQNKQKKVDMVLHSALCLPPSSLVPFCFLLLLLASFAQSHGRSAEQMGFPLWCMCRLLPSCTCTIEKREILFFYCLQEACRSHIRNLMFASISLLLA